MQPTATTEPASRAIEPGAVYTVNEAAALLSLHPVTMRNKLRDGAIKGRRKAGGTWRVMGSELLRVAA